MSVDFALFRLDVNVGDRINLIFDDSKRADVSGIVLEIGDQFVLMLTQEGRKSRFFSSMIGSWEVLPDDAQPKPIVENTVTDPVSFPSVIQVSTGFNSQPQEIKSMPEKVTQPAAISLDSILIEKEMIRLESKWDTQIKQAMAALKYRPLLMEMPDPKLVAETQRKEFSKDRDLVLNYNRDMVRSNQSPNSLQLDKACSVLNKMLKVMPGNESLHFNLASFYVRNGDFIHALQHLETSCRQKLRLDNTYNAAAAAIRLNDTSRACWWLGHHCILEREEMEDQAWFCLSKWVHELKAYSLWEEMSDRIVSQEGSPKIIPLLFDAITYEILKRRPKEEIVEAGKKWISFKDRKIEDCSISEIREQVQLQMKSLAGDYSPAWKEFLQRLDEESKMLREKEQQMARDARRQLIEESVKQAMTKANQLISSGKTNIALADLQHFIRTVGTHPEIEKLISRLINSKTGSRGETGFQSIPSRGGDTLFKRGVLLVQQGEEEKAEQVFLRAIESRDQTEKAVKELTALYQRRRTIDGYTKSAQILEKHRKQVEDKNWLLRNLAANYEKSEQFEKAIPVFEEIKKVIPSEEQNCVTHIAICLVGTGDIDRAEKTLKELLASSKNMNVRASQLLTEIQSRRKAGRGFESSKELTELASGVSPLIRFFLNSDRDEYNYFGLEKKMATEKGFSESTIAYLDQRIEEYPIQKFPWERALTFFTKARVLQDLNRLDSEKFADALRQFCIGLGDYYLAATERVRVEVARSFYVEGFHCDQSWGVQHRITAGRYMLSYAFNGKVAANDYSAGLTDVFEKVFNKESVKDEFWHGILDLFIVNAEATQQVIKSFWNHTKAQAESIEYMKKMGFQKASVSDFKSYVQVWDQLRSKRNQELVDCETQLRASTPTEFSTSSADNFRQSLETNQLRAWLNDWDRQLLRGLIGLGDEIAQYGRESTYAQKKLCLDRIERTTQEMATKIEEQPTRFGVKVILQIISDLNVLTTKTAKLLDEKSTPIISIKLANYSTTPDELGLVSLQLAISNEAHCAPVNNLTVHFDTQRDPGLYAMDQSIYHSPASLQGGEKRIIKCQIHPSREAVLSAVIPIQLEVTFGIRGTDSIQSQSYKFSVQLISSDDWIKIDNKYALIAEGGPVTNKDMMFGRQELIEQIVDALDRSDAKCYALYGQRRSGKSTVRHHVLEDIRKKGYFLITEHNIGGLKNEIKAHRETAIYYNIIKGICFELGKRRRDGKVVPDVSMVSYQSLSFAPFTLFSEWIEQFRIACAELEEWKDIRILVALDEFTALYPWIREGLVSTDFTKNWKTALENRYFSSLLIGQDVMPRFVEKYGNDFGISEPVWLNYFDEADANLFMRKPLETTKGEHRDRQDALRRIWEMTAGNPYYLAMLGNRLVNHLNKKRHIAFTEADVEEVVQSMTEGGGSAVLEGKFENLLKSTEGHEYEYQEQQVRQILYQIAQQSRNAPCPRSAIKFDPPALRDAIIEDLKFRRVINFTPENPDSFQITIGLFHQWLLHNPP
jgi:tetratricopeptide (TPR) repeat protein/AAA+ ATPase superfamily predicted ATPase